MISQQLDLTLESAAGESPLALTIDRLIYSDVRSATVTASAACPSTCDPGLPLRGSPMK